MAPVVAQRPQDPVAGRYVQGEPRTGTSGNQVPGNIHRKAHVQQLTRSERVEPAGKQQLEPGQKTRAGHFEGVALV